MYAHGQKYRQGESLVVGTEVVPKLVLVYPCSEKFMVKLPEFLYEDIKDKIGLRLFVDPFDLTDKTTYESQVNEIINLTSTD